MFTNAQLHFFKQKILDLNTALFHNESNAVLKIPNNIISILKVDEIGQLWFFLKPPGQHISELEHTFYANLSFLRKGCDFFLKVEGKAFLVTDPEEINELPDFTEKLKEKARKEEILVKLKASNIAYHECQRRETHSWLLQIAGLFSKLLRSNRPAYRFFRLETDPGF